MCPNRTIPKPNHQLRHVFILSFFIIMPKSDQFLNLTVSLGMFLFYYLYYFIIMPRPEQFLNRIPCKGMLNYYFLLLLLADTYPKVFFGHMLWQDWKANLQTHALLFSSLTTTPCLA